MNGNYNSVELGGTSGDGLRTQILRESEGPETQTQEEEESEDNERVGPERLSLSRLVFNKKESTLLSSKWVEMLMGFPEDWTAIDGPPVGGKRSAKRSRRARRKGARSRTTERG